MASTRRCRASGWWSPRTSTHAPAEVLFLLPLLGLFAVFAHERNHRLRGLLELNSAYRGTALVLSDVVESDDHYTGQHSRSVVELALTLADRPRAERRAQAEPRVRSAPARRRQDRDSEGDREQARQARHRRVDDHPDAHARGRKDALAGRRIHARGRDSSSAPTTSVGTAAAIRTGSPARRSRSRPASSRAATAGTRCGPTASTARRSRSRSRSTS